MKIVIDTNILFSSLLSKSSKLRKILLNKDYQFFSPNFVFVEIFKHKEKILKYTKSSEVEVYEYLNEILKKIHFVNEEIISKENRQRAYELCVDIDKEDIPMIALAIELNADVWTGDTTLREGLNKKGFIKFFIPQDK